MRFRSGAVAVCVAVCVQAHPAGAQTRLLTLSDVLARAREQAPQIVSARLALEEMRGRLAGASLRLHSNPEIDAGVGPRHGAGGRLIDFEIGLRQSLEPDSRRSARIAGASAAIAQGAADVDEVTRVVLRSAADAYYRAVHANQRIRLLNVSQELAAGVYSVADRRFRAGDIAVLDVNLARASLARVRAEREAAESVKAVALGDLKRLLRLDEDIGVAGELTRSPEADLTAILQNAVLRPELRALEAAAREAEADAQLGGSYTKPDYGFSVRYSREEGDQIVLGGMTLTLPVVSKGQELSAVGAARAARLRAELDAARTLVRLEVQSAFEAYTRRLAAVRVLETEAIPGLDENEMLATRSFEVGQLGLPELLLIRREILDTRSQYLHALLEAALARLELDASAAVLR